MSQRQPRTQRTTRAQQELIQVPDAPPEASAPFHPGSGTILEPQQAARSTDQAVPFHDDDNLGIERPFMDPTQVIDVDEEPVDEPPPKLPRTQDSLYMTKLVNVVMYVDVNGNIQHLQRPEDVKSWHSFGNLSSKYYQAYLASDQRQQDVEHIGNATALAICLASTIKHTWHQTNDNKMLNTLARNPKIQTLQIILMTLEKNNYMKPKQHIHKHKHKHKHKHQHQHQQHQRHHHKHHYTSRG